MDAKITPLLPLKIIFEAGIGFKMGSIVGSLVGGRDGGDEEVGTQSEKERSETRDTDRLLLIAARGAGGKERTGERMKRRRRRRQFFELAHRVTDGPTHSAQVFVQVLLVSRPN